MSLLGTLLVDDTIDRLFVSEALLLDAEDPVIVPERDGELVELVAMLLAGLV